MTRSQEEVVFGVGQRPREIVRLRKVIVTREVTVTVEVRREELVVDRVPVEGDEESWKWLPPPPDTGRTHRFVLHEEVPEIRRVVVPRERVAVAFPSATQTTEVTAPVRREVIQAESIGPDDQTAAEDVPG